MTDSIHRLTRCAVLTALALAISVCEGLVPLSILIPLPGLRLGLANLVTVYALCRLSGREALGILVSRLHVPGLSLFGVCIAGAAAHNTGQILAAMAVLASPAIAVYLAPLLLASLLTGAVTGAASILLVRRVPWGS